MTQYHSMTITNSESITHYSNVIKLYIGIASGDEPEEALRRRSIELVEEEGEGQLDQYIIYISPWEDGVKLIDWMIMNLISFEKFLW